MCQRLLFSSSAISNPDLELLVPSLMTEVTPHKLFQGRGECADKTLKNVSRANVAWVEITNVLSQKRNLVAIGVVLEMGIVLFVEVVTVVVIVVAVC